MGTQYSQTFVARVPNVPSGYNVIAALIGVFVSGSW